MCRDISGPKAVTDRSLRSEAFGSEQPLKGVPPPKTRLLLHLAFDDHDLAVTRIVRIDLYRL